MFAASAIMASLYLIPFFLGAFWPLIWKFLDDNETRAVNPVSNFIVGLYGWTQVNGYYKYYKYASDGTTVLERTVRLSWPLYQYQLHSFYGAQP
jgi:hypothetical protein